MLYCLAKGLGFCPRPDQSQIRNDVLQDLMSRDGKDRRVRPMLMGKGKTSMITPWVLMDAHFGSLHTTQTAWLVLPTNLVPQSVTMLQRDMSAQAIVPVSIVLDGSVSAFAETPDRSEVRVISDTDLKTLMIMHGKAHMETSSSDVYLFDEVDTLTNPQTSELNIVQGGTANRAVDRDLLAKLFVSICDAVADSRRHPGRRGALLTGAFDDCDSNREIRAYVEGVWCGAFSPLRNKVHYGVVGAAEYARRGLPASRIALPFEYADTPRFGSLFSDIALSMPSRRAISSLERSWTRSSTRAAPIGLGERPSADLPIDRLAQVPERHPGERPPRRVVAPGHAEQCPTVLPDEPHAMSQPPVAGPGRG